MGDWRRHYRSDWSDDFAHPDSPAGGGSTGPARPPDSGAWDSLPVPHPDSPMGREYDPLSILHIDLFERVAAVHDALEIAEHRAGAEIWKVTGEDLSAVAKGFLPGLLKALAMVAVPTLLGAAGGAALGSLALGIGALPGAAFGAEIGLAAGLGWLEILGLSELLTSIVGSLHDAFERGRHGVTQAWDSVEQPTVGARALEVELGGQAMAEAVALLMKAILEGLVAFLLARGANAAAARVPELLAKLRASELGAGFASWVERNWERLIERSQRKGSSQRGAAEASGEPAAAASGSGSGGGEAGKTPSTKPSESKASAKQSTEPPPAREEPSASAAPSAKTEAASEGHQVPEQQIESTGEPVDVATGKVFTDKVDLELPGLLGFRFRRIWFSTSTYAGPLGHGWHCSYDATLHVGRERILYQLVDGRTITLPVLSRGEHFDRKERITLLRDDAGYAVRTADQQLWRFASAHLDASTQLLRAIEHPSGRRVALRYDAADRLTQVIDGAGRTITFEHDAQGRIAKLFSEDPTERRGRVLVMRYEYNRDGDLVRVTDALGRNASYRYEQHQLVQSTDRNGLSFRFDYDGSGPNARCIRTRGDRGLYDHKLSYDVARGLTTVENSLGYKTLYEHRGGLVRRKVDPLGAVTLTEYDEHNQKRAEIDALGQRTSYFYDERGNLLRIVQADGSEVRATYDGHDRLERVIEPGGATWRYVYDALGRVCERIDPLGQRTRYRYLGSDLEEIIDAAGQRYAFTHDPSGNLTALHAPDGTVRRWTYDRLGRAQSATDAAGNEQRLTRDALGRVLRIHEPDGNLRELSYDAEGNLVRVQDQHRDIALSYCGIGRLQARHEAGGSVYFEYDTEERLLSVTNQHGQTYRFERNATGEVSAEIPWSGQRRCFDRDVLGRVLERTRPNGLRSRYLYDAVGRVTAVEHSDGDSEHYAFAPDGSLVAADNSSCQLRFERDALGRVTRESRDAHWVQSEYDVLGRRVRLRSSLGASQRIRRDATGRATAIAAGPFTAEITRDALGLELERTLPGGARSHWQRDKLGRPLAQTLTAHDEQGSTTRTLRYSWEADDRLVELVDSNHGLVRYGRDGAARLIWARYTYGAVDLRFVDEVGNLFRSERRDDRVYGPAGELLEARDERGQVTKYAYDEDGNLIEKLEPGERRWGYSWNAAGRLTRVTRPDGSEVSFRYDVFGRRIEKRYRGQTTHFVWDGNVPLHEWVEGSLAPARDASPSPDVAEAHVQQREADLEAHLAQGPPRRGTARKPITWLFEPDSFIPMAHVRGEICQSIIADQLGTPVAMVTGGGSLVWSASNDTFGELHHVRGGSRHACPFRFQGQYEDAETGLYYNRHRYYDPRSASYISQDPIGLAGGLQLHGYVEDPTRSIDPHGLCGGADASNEIGDDVDAAFDSGRVTSGTMVRAPADGLAGSGPKQGQGDIWYHDNVKVSGAGPDGSTVNIRTHSPNPNAPPGSYSQSNYTTQVNTNSGRYLLPDGQWKTIGEMTPAERAAAHFPAGN